MIVDDVGHRLDGNAGVRCHVLERCGHRRTVPTITTLYPMHLQRNTLHERASNGRAESRQGDRRESYHDGSTIVRGNATMTYGT